MGGEGWSGGAGRPGASEPVFNLPTVVTAMVAILVAVAVGRMMLSPSADDLLVLTFAFVPDRYVLDGGAPVWPGGYGAMAWTFLTHALLHEGWAHLGFNAAMLAALGKGIHARIGGARLIGLLAFATIGGALGHLAVNWGSPAAMLGASGGVSGLLGALLRFVFRPNWMPAASIGEALGESRVRGVIVALVVMNVALVALGTALFGGGGGNIAWGAHLGGFLAGFLGFSAFDRSMRR